MGKLTLSGLCKSFGAVAAVDGVSLTLHEREFMVLVGPTGCGKTTLLRLIAGVEKPDGGHIYLDGNRLNDIPIGRRGVQLIFQNYALWPHMRVHNPGRFSNLGFALKVRRWLPEAISQRVAAVMRRVGIGQELSSRFPNQLSAGQQQKVAIGRSMAIPPRVFLMDEPMSNIDPVAKRRVRAEIRRVHEEMGAISLLVTHDLDDAFQLADRIAVMREGRILQVDEPERLCREPNDPFVSDFLSAFDRARPPMRGRGGGEARPPA
ncbi:MAG: ABC transporter ATP-binding protein [bacterium]